MQRMQHQLADTIRRIRGGTETITVAATQIAAGNLDLPARTEEQASRAGGTMHSLVDAVRRVTDIISEISAASEEQTRGIEQVNVAIAQMDEATQQNAAMVEEAAAAAQSMQEQAQMLRDVVNVFRL